VKHTNVTGGATFGSSFSDNATNIVTVNVRQNTNWTVSTGNGFSGTSLSLRVQGNAATSEVTNPTNLRLTLASGIAPDTAADGGGTNLLPQANRVGMTSAHLSNTFYIGGSSVQNPLPVRLTAFGATTRELSVDLVWETAFEQDLNRFELEKSNDGVSFEYLTSLAVAGNSMVAKTHLVTDEYAFTKSSTVFYRLKIINLDGSVDYSRIVSAQTGNAHALHISTVYPNPVSYHATVTINSYINQDVKVDVLDLKGSIVCSTEAVIDKGTNAVSVNLSSLANGLYFIRFTADNETQYAKVIKE
jgi:hypothetical protein